MAKARSTRKKVAARPRATRREPAPKWVRKRVVIDQRKLDVARKNFKVTTDKETIDKALDFVKFYVDLSDGLETIRLSGGLIDYEGVLKDR